MLCINMMLNLQDKHIGSTFLAIGGPREICMWPAR